MVHLFSESAELAAENTLPHPGLRRLEVLRDQMVRENRRSAVPFCHPLAAHGPLSKLRDQIRDVSRIADAVAVSAETAGSNRVQQLCQDLRRLVQTQQRWTERLENQIWRIESQTALMKRLQRVLLQGSPATDQLWALCELIARETQGLPQNLLLLPEPGLRIISFRDSSQRALAEAIELARFSVAAAMSLFPGIRGAELAATSLQTAARRLSKDSEVWPWPLGPFELLAGVNHSCADSSAAKGLPETVAVAFSRIDNLSVLAAHLIVPPDLQEFYAELLTSRDHCEQTVDSALFAAFLKSLGLAERAEPDQRDAQLVLTHKLRWNDSEPLTLPSGGHSARHPSNRRPHLHFAQSAEPLRRLEDSESLRFSTGSSTVTEKVPG